MKAAEGRVQREGMQYSSATHACVLSRVGLVNVIDVEGASESEGAVNVPCANGQSSEWGESGEETHRIREPTIRCVYQNPSALAYPVRSRLESGVSKEAVFGRQVCRDDVRVVREVARANQAGKGSA